MEAVFRQQGGGERERRCNEFLDEEVREACLSATAKVSDSSGGGSRG